MKPELLDVLLPIALDEAEILNRINYLTEKYGTLPSDFVSFASRFSFHDSFNHLQFGNSSEEILNTLFGLASSATIPKGFEEYNDFLEEEELLPDGCLAIASYDNFYVYFLRLSDGAVLGAYYQELEYGDKFGNAKRLSAFVKSHSAFIDCLSWKSPLDHEE